METSTTHYLFILDKSGSMANCWNETLDALGHQYQLIEQHCLKHPEQPVRASLVYFNVRSQRAFWNIDGTELSQQPFRFGHPAGGTALMDAIGLSIHQLQVRMKPQDDAIVMMLTDGEENSSKVYSFQQISEFMGQLKETGKWTFTLLGADVDAFEAIGQKLKMNRNQVFMYKKSQTKEAFDEVNEKMIHFFEKKSKGESTKDAFLFRDLF